MEYVDVSVGNLPSLIQGGMGFAVSDWRLARVVSKLGQLGVVSGAGLDVVLVRRLQNGDVGGDVRRALAAFPDTELAGRVLAKFFVEGGKGGTVPFVPMAPVSVAPSKSVLELIVLGGFVEVWLAKEGHAGVVGINLLEKIQVSTVGTLFGAMLAGVDVVLMGAGVPREIPRVLNELADGEEYVWLPVDVEGADAGEFGVTLCPRDVLSGYSAQSHTLPVVKRPVFLAIVSAHVLAAYLAREEEIRPDGFIVELSPAGGHNAPPRRLVVGDDGGVVFGPRDEPDLGKVAAAGLPFWVAGAVGSPDGLAEALRMGAQGVQVGTVFALSSDSGLRPDLRERLLEGLRSGTLHVLTDPLASPTGFPFKVASVEGTLSEDTVYGRRERLCDQGYLRTAYKREDGKVGYRCAAEPEHMYVKKGGVVEDTVGRKCICNGLIATVGLGQVRKDGRVEPPIVTLGSDLGTAERLLAMYPDGWSARNVVEWILS